MSLGNSSKRCPGWWGGTRVCTAPDNFKYFWCTIFLSMFISFLYMFRTTVCPSSGETTVFMRHLALVILCGWLQGGMKFHGCFSRWWAHRLPKCVEIDKYNSVPLQACSGPEGSRKLRFPDYVTVAEDGGKVVSLTLRPPLPPGNTPGTHFC